MPFVSTNVKQFGWELLFLLLKVDKVSKTCKERIELGKALVRASEKASGSKGSAKGKAAPKAKPKDP